METLGYLSSILIGLTLGLLGSGGSILTVPVLVYLFAVDVVAATTYSLFVVGLTSAVGSFTYLKNGLINIKTALIFGIPSIITVFITRKFIVPSIPLEIFRFESYVVTKNNLLMLLFAVLMIASSLKMIKNDKKILSEIAENSKFDYITILLNGLFVGFLAGLIGAGGGFLIIPALVFLSKLQMKEAIGTSLVIIAVNSSIGFLSNGSQSNIDWSLLAKVCTFAIIGIVIGSFLSKKIDGAKLKPVFGWFVLAMGIYIILKETIIK